jgi:hypothetical protein
VDFEFSSKLSFDFWGVKWRAKKILEDAKFLRARFSLVNFFSPRASQQRHQSSFMTQEYNENICW